MESAPEPSAEIEEVAAAEDIKGPKTILLGQLQAAVAQAVSQGRTPLVVDPSAAHVVDTFYGYSAVLVDAKQLSLDVAMKKLPQEDALEKARKGLVSALQGGRTLVVSMQQGSPSFNEWFDAPTAWPMASLTAGAGKALTVADPVTKEFGAGAVKAVMRDADMVRHSGFAICGA